MAESAFGLVLLQNMQYTPLESCNEVYRMYPSDSDNTKVNYRVPYHSLPVWVLQSDRRCQKEEYPVW